MIQANELRIGNVITHQNNNGIYLVTVIEALKNGVNVKTGFQLGEWFLRYEEVKGTPITEDWLFKFGFEIDHTKQSWFHITYVIGEFELININNSYEYENKPILYVHQLQNLYFALTCSELVLSTVPEATKPAL